MPSPLYVELSLVQSVLAVALIVIGGVVEGYGYGLSLGTKWPYTKNMPALAKTGDPEVWHRIVATLLGLNSIAIIVLKPGIVEITGFVLIAVTALLGMATLYVLSGKAPSFIQGLHDILAYLTLLNYLLIVSGAGLSLGEYLLVTIPLHSFLLTIFMGGFTTGKRGFKTPIGHFVYPKSASQWVWIVHGVSVLLFTLTLAYYMPAYNVAFLILLVEIGIGLLSYQAVNANAARPGFLIPLHQFLSVMIFVSIFYAWHIHLPLLG
jgi:hypothetical protein